MDWRKTENETLDFFNEMTRLGFSKEKIYEIIEDIVKKYGRGHKFQGISVYSGTDKGFSKTGELIKGENLPKIKIEIENCWPYLIQSIA